MSVSGVNSTYTAPVATAATNTKATDVAEKTQATVEEEAAVYEKSEQTESKLYTRDNGAIANIRAKDSAYLQNLQHLVTQLVNQVNRNNAANGNFGAKLHGQLDPAQVNSYWDLLVDNGDGTFSFHPDLSPAAQNTLISQAQADIGEDGYYGVKQTSQRILDFAKAITGGDPSKIALMRDSIEKGFGEARSMLGGWLPDISNETYDAVMAGLDAWEASANTASTVADAAVASAVATA
jgi:tRNA threonylcarbamoyladenosine modification (KEOPS) complex  Pcc1 subunit